MKLLSTFLISLLVVTTLYAQQPSQASAVSDKIFISVTREKAAPPYLEIKNYQFIDANQNNMIDANEEVMVRFDLQNSGSGPAVGLLVQIEEINHVGGLKFVNPQSIPEIKPGTSARIEVSVRGGMNLSNGLASFRIIVREPMGFGPDPLPVEIETQAYKPPEVALVDYQVSSQLGGNLEKRTPFDLEILIQNLGQGNAEDVSVNVSAPENVYCWSGNLLQSIGDLKAGEQRLVSYSFIANNDFQENTINFHFTINEATGLYTANKNVNLEMNQKVSVDKLVVRGIRQENKNIEVASLSSDVDKEIPVHAKKHMNKVALIIGNEDYSGRLNAEVNVDYARHDANVFSQYASKTLGIPEENIFLYTDATYGIMNTQIDRICELVKRMGKETELIFYYAGHGHPDEQNHTPYLIPVDGNGSNLNSAFALKEVYKKFGETGAKKITVLLDACFSGGGRNQGLLSARGIRIKPKEEDLMGNMVVFSASTGEQTALPYHDQKHGLFTYFLLKKLKESGGMVTFGELDSYLKTNIGLTSIRANEKVQDPVTTVSPGLYNSWKDSTF